jgi:hypothetical protein
MSDFKLCRAQHSKNARREKPGLHFRDLRQAVKKIAEENSGR